MKKYTVAEFFCGCGGFSRGFAKSGRFNVVLGNDIKKEALRTFEFNHQHDGLKPAIIQEDIRKVPISQIKELLKKQGVAEGDLDCLIGGPPCQGFSQLRRSAVRDDNRIVKFKGYSKLMEDPRNDLVLRFLEIAAELQPKFIVIENVPQMLSHGFKGHLGKLAETVLEILTNLGYSADVAVLNAADYGVPQLRQRAIFMASLVGPVSFPETTHANVNSEDLLAQGKAPWVTVYEAISDLPEPIKGKDILGGKGTELYIGTPSDYAKIMQSSVAFPYNHVTRNYKQSVLDIIKEMRPGETWDAASERMKATYEELIKETMLTGMAYEEAKKKLIEIGKINPVFYKKYYWSAYSRLSWDQPALTITANASFLGSGRYTHPELMRGITMREAARLQSFDDDFRFITSVNDEKSTDRISVGMDMIGEAVPPLMAKAIASHIAYLLDNSPKQIKENTIEINV